MIWDCKTFDENIFAYLDNEMSKEDAACFLDHSKNCPACAKALAEAEAFEVALHDACQLVEPPANFVNQVMAALPKAEVVAKAKIHKFPIKRLVGSFGTVAAAVAIVFGISLANPNVDLPVTPIPNPPNVADNQEDPLINQPVVTDPKDEQPVVAEPKAPVVVAEKPNTPQTKPEDNDSIDKPVVNPGSNNNNGNNNNSGSGNIQLPKAAYGVASDGILATRLLADFGKEENIYAPTLSANADTVSYYTKNKDGVFLWKSSVVTPGEPECLGLAEAKADASVETLLKNTCPTYDTNTSVFSPDKSMIAINARGDEEGVWISNVGTKTSDPWKLCGEGGGKILSWSPNGAKLLFTDKDGKLYVGYPVEKRIFIVTEDKVTDLVWGKDSKTVVIAAQATGKTNTSLVTVQIP